MAVAVSKYDVAWYWIYYTVSRQLWREIRQTTYYESWKPDHV